MRWSEGALLSECEADGVDNWNRGGRARISLFILILLCSLVTRAHQRETNVLFQSDNKCNLHNSPVPVEINRRILSCSKRTSASQFPFNISAAPRAFEDGHL